MLKRNSCALLYLGLIYSGMRLLYTLWCIMGNNIVCSHIKLFCRLQDGWTVRIRPDKMCLLALVGMIFFLFFWSKACRVSTTWLGHQSIAAGAMYTHIHTRLHTWGRFMPHSIEAVTPKTREVQAATSDQLVSDKSVRFCDATHRRSIISDLLHFEIHTQEPYSLQTTPLSLPHSSVTFLKETPIGISYWLAAGFRTRCRSALGPALLQTLLIPD